MNSLLHWCLACVTALLAAGSAPNDLRASKVDTVVTAFMAARHVPGMSIAIQENGVTVLSKGYGVANLVRKTPVTPATRFELGSLTKQFTAAAVLRLAASGKLRLSDPLAKYVPRYTAARAVTIRQLLMHASGVPDYVATNHFLALASHRPGGFDQILTLVEHRPLDFPPGTKSAYSNTNYILLGRIIEAVSGVGYDRFVRENVLAAAGMKRTTTIAEESRLDDMATGYNTGVVSDLAQSIDPATDANAASRIEPAPAFGAAWASSAGNLVSDVSDVLAWDDAFLRGRIVSLTDVSLATEPAALADGTVTDYGFGWEIDRVDGHRRIFFDGGTFGFASTNQTWPDDHVRIVILSNSAAAPLTRLGQRVFEAFHRRAGSAADVAQSAYSGRRAGTERPDIRRLAHMMKPSTRDQVSDAKANGTPENIDDYLAGVSEPARSTLNAVRATIRSVVPPETTESIWYGIPTFKYKRALVSFAAFARHCSFFPLSAAIIVAFKHDLEGFKTSKGTIQFPVDKPLPAALITKIVKARIAENEVRSAQRGAVIATLCLCIVSAIGVTGFGAAAAGTPDACAMLSTNQLRSWFGKDMVAKPTPGIPQAQGCQWSPKDGSSGSLTVTIGPARYYVAPKLGAGYKALSGIGEKAYIVPSLGGWEAGAVKGSKVVGIRTPAMRESVAVTVLKTLVAKL